MSRQRKGSRGPEGAREPSQNVLLPGNGHSEDSPGAHLTQVSGNIIQLRPQEALNYQGRAALRIAERGMRHGGRRAPRLLHLAGYLAGQSLAFDPARRRAAK